MSALPFASNQEIDDAVLALITKSADKGIKSLAIRGELLATKLPLKPLPGFRPGGEGWNAQEHANRSCQRLRKRGLVTFNGKMGWTLVVSK